MANHIRQTIADLQTRLKDQEQQVVKTKSLINQLCDIDGMPPMYADDELQTSSAKNINIRADEFYGKPLATAVRRVLEIRKGLNQGPASVDDLYAALMAGSYDFETKNETNAKRILGISLSKNMAFHRLPSGLFGLADWYDKATVKRAKSAGQNASGNAAADDNGATDGSDLEEGEEAADAEAEGKQ